MISTAEVNISWRRATVGRQKLVQQNKKKKELVDFQARTQIKHAIRFNSVVYVRSKTDAHQKQKKAREEREELH